MWKIAFGSRARNMSKKGICRPGADHYYVGVRSGMRMTHLFHVYIASFLLDQSTHEFHGSTVYLSTKIVFVSVTCYLVPSPLSSYVVFCLLCFSYLALSLVSLPNSGRFQTLILCSHSHLKSRRPWQGSQREESASSLLA